ncbi:MAG: HYR domain-containing protein [Saprospiraceae bacterium]|nr:HYR domain-containing protein [Saprospiraceae bacterium]
MNTNRSHNSLMRCLYASIISLLIFQVSFSQLTGAKSIPGDYSTIAAAVNDINALGVGAGGVVFNVAAGHIETAPVGGIILTATGTAANPIEFKKSGSGANPLINAYVGVSTPGSTATDGIFILSGSDFVTIDGIDLFDGNTASPTEMMECGYGLFKVDGTNGAQDNTIKNCKITLNRNSNAAWTGLGHNGSCAIVIHNSTYATKAVITVTSPGGSNSRNKFYTNQIENCNAGIVFIGFLAVSPFTLGDTLNDVGGISSTTGNTILNYGGIPGAPGSPQPATGIFANNQWGLNISYNTINNNNGSGVNHVSTLRGIFMNSSSTSASANCNFNNITIKGGGQTSQVAAIENSFGSTAAGNIININNNTITGEYLTATSGVFYGIFNTATSAFMVNMNNNTVSNINYGSISNTGTGALHCLYSTAAVTHINVNGNTVSNIMRTGSTGGQTNGINITSGTNQTAKKNLIENMMIDGSGTTSTMYGIQTATGTIVVDSNTVKNLKCLKTTGVSNLYGIYNISSPTNENFNYNTVQDIAHSGTGIVYGIYAFTTTGVRTVSNNTVFNLSTFGTTIGGINQSSSTPQIFKNKIYDITSFSSGAPTVFGIQITSSSGTSAIYNNLIGNLFAPNANLTAATSPSIRGINFTSTSTATYNVSYNSVYINAKSFGANFGSTALFHTTSTTSTVATLNLINNNLVNLSIPKGIGKTVVHQRSSTTLTNYGSTSNRNNVYAGGACINRLLYFDGTNSDSTLAQYKTRVSTRDANSISESPFFLSTVGSSTNFLHIDPAKPTLLESGGTPIAGITDDYDGNARNGSTPDIGADEFVGTIATACSGTPNAGTITATPNPLCSGNSTTLCVNGLSMNSDLTYTWKSSTSPSGPFVDVSCAKDKCLSTDTLASGLYYYQLEVTCIPSGLSATTPTYTVTVNSSPVVSITPSAPVICAGASVSITATGGITYSWSPSTGLNTTSGATVIASPVSTTTYIVTVTDAVGCSSTKSVLVSVNPSPIIVATADPDTICIGGNSNLNVTETCLIAKNNIFSTTTGATLDPMTGSTIVVASGVDDLPMSLDNVSAGNAQPIGFTFTYDCNTYTHFSASPDGWVHLANTTTPAVSQFTNDLISLTNIPKISAYWDDMATGTTGNVRVLLSGTAPNRIFKIQWFTTIPRNTAGAANSTFQMWLYETTNVIEFKYGTLGTSAASASAGLSGNAPGTNFQSITFSNNSNSTTTVNNLNTTQPVVGTLYSYTPIQYTSYAWSPSTFLNATNIKNPIGTGITSTTTYTVTVTASNGCTKSSSVTVVVNPTITLAVTESSGTPNDGVICSGSNVSITATGGGTYNWSTGGTASSITETPLMTTTYTVTVTSADGCVGSKSITITVNPSPIVSISPNPGNVTPPMSVTLTATGGGTYLWNTGETTAAITKAPIVNTTYTVTVTSSNGCTASSTVLVTVNLATTPDLYTCHNRVHPGYTFTGTTTWRKTSGTGGPASTIATSGTGNIPSFTATNASNCNLLTDSVFVTQSVGIDTFLINTATIPTVNQIRDSSMCDAQMWTPPAFTGNCTAQTTFRWVKKPGPGGTQLPALPLSGSGNLPKLTIVNPPPSCLILTDTIIVTPVYLIPNSTDSCLGTAMRFIVKSVPTPVLNSTRDTTFCANTNPSGFILTSNCSVTTQRWRKSTVGGPANSGTTIPSSGNGSIPAFATINPTNVIRTDTIIVLSIFISVGDSCVSKPDTFLIHVLPVATATQVRDTMYCSGISIPQRNFTGSYTGAGIKYNWTRTGVAIGLTPLNGMDNIPAFTTMNITNAPVTETFTVTPVIMLNGVMCSGTPMIFRITVLPAPRAICRNATIYVDNNGNATLDPTLISNGSVGGTLRAVPTNFTCRNLGPNAVTLIVTDPCGASNSCAATVTVLDTVRPVITCKDVTINLQPGDCQGRLYYVPSATDNCSVAMVIAEDTAKYGSGKFIDKGVHTVCYMAMDQSGNTSRCCSKITVMPYQGATKALACNNEIQLSLDQNCRVTVRPEMALEGGPYKCYEEYVVRIQLWAGGPFIDRDQNLPGVQLDGRDIGKEFKITVVDTATGNSCWSKATVEDKWAPVITCNPNISISCAVDPSPTNTGIPSVVENCGGFSLTFSDDATQGSCVLGFQERIIRTWVAIDGSNNRSTCVQTITVRLGDIFDVEVPRNYDNIDLPALKCNEKIDRNKDVSPHISDFPECVDGYILDSAFWRANPNAPNIYPNRRLPRILGWNCLDDTTNLSTFGNPNPDPVYYPQHRQWSPQNPLCWGPNRHVMWIGTGRPSGAATCRNLNIVYEDIKFNLAQEGCDAGVLGCYKVLRQWTVLDWCTSVIAGHNQIIKVGDLEGPEVIYPDSARVNMESYACQGRWEVPAPWLLDNCSNELHYSVEVEFGTVTGNERDGFLVINMPEGIQTGYIVATDCCGNITKKRVVLNVVDRVPPTAVCRTFTTVSIIGNQSPNENLARISASDLDEGSYDNCQQHVWFKMIRMSELLGTNNGSNANNVNACQGVNGDDNIVLAGNQIYFDDFSYFCCADAGQRVMVVLRVFDVDPGAGPVTPARMNSTTNVLNGRFSDCMVEVEVQNKSVPTVIAPPNIIVSCSFWFDINTLTNPNDATFGRVVTDLTARRKVVTNDIVCHKYCERNQITQYPGYVQTNANPKPAPNQACDFYNAYFDTAHWDRKYELIWGFDGYVLNACGNPNPTISVNDLRECGQGQIQRVVSIVGPNNINVSAIQTIWVVDCDPFFVDTNTCNDPRFTDLLWPNGVCTQTPVTIEGCGGDVSPDNPQLGRPQIINNSDDNCALISIEYKDEIFDIEPDACYKILRTWTVIDWCQYDPFINANRGRWSALQVIKVRDRNRPEVECVMGDCEPATLNTSKGVCYGHINLSASATDNCTPLDWLLWEYKIDINNDGKGVHGGFDARVGSLTQKQQSKGDTTEYSHNPYADDRHNPFNASGNYPIGTHNICWFVEDGCGNVGTCCGLFTIRDCKAPTPYCASGIITVPMPSSGCVEIWATDLDRGSFDNCTPKDKLKFYFNDDPTAPSIKVCCDDFVEKKVNDELIFEVELWVEDEEGNKDYCKTIIIVQDNKLCPDVGSATGTITGQMMTEKNDEASPVEVRLYMSGQMIQLRTGSPYSFGNLDLRQQYIIEPLRNDDHLNGVSTQDIVAIQKHILGKEELSSPYKLIAADVNESKSITTADIAEIRKLILGITPEFTKVKSWTFVSNNYRFTDPKNPYLAPRTDNVKFDQTQVAETKSRSFMAVKMGDVTNNARAKGIGSVQARNNKSLQLLIDNQITDIQEEVRVDVRSSNFKNIEGFQFTLKYDNKSILFERAESAQINIDESNFGTTRLSEGILTSSWNSNKAETVDPNKVLFTLIFKASKITSIHKAMIITGDVTAAQAYNNEGEVLNVQLNSREGSQVVETSLFDLYQNEPNPFDKQTTINYRLPEDGAAILTIYDLTGKVVRVYNLRGVKGLNQHVITKSEINSKGILYYQLDAANNTATKKMVITD